MRFHDLDGILTNGDEVAAGIIQVYHGSKKPLIVGQDNLLLSKLLNFSSIDTHLAEFGQKAFQLFEDQKIIHVQIATEFIRR